MKLSCLPVSFYPRFNDRSMTLGAWFRFAAETGLDGADISVSHLPGSQPAVLDALRREAEDAGVQIPMMVLYTDFTHPDPMERSRQVELVRRMIDVAARLGMTFLRTTAGQAHPGVERAQGIAWAVAGLTACLDDAAAAGITLAYENHTKGSPWTYNDFTQSADRFLDVMALTEDTTLGLLFDTANNLALNDDPLQVLQAVKKRVSTVHLSDIEAAGSFKPVVLGTGVCPLKALLGVLAEQGFDGWLSVEEASFTGEEGFRQAIPYARQVWEDAKNTP